MSITRRYCVCANGFCRAAAAQVVAVECRVGGIPRSDLLSATPRRYGVIMVTRNVGGNLLRSYTNYRQIPGLPIVYTDYVYTVGTHALDGNENNINKRYRNVFLVCQQRRAQRRWRPSTHGVAMACVKCTQNSTIVWNPRAQDFFLTFIGWFVRTLYRKNIPILYRKRVSCVRANRLFTRVTKTTGRSKKIVFIRYKIDIERNPSTNLSK